MLIDVTSASIKNMLYLPTVEEVWILTGLSVLRYSVRVRNHRTPLPGTQIKALTPPVDKGTSFRNSGGGYESVRHCECIPRRVDWQ